MLALRPNCEHCNKDLPPHSTEAMICSFECTFCLDCVATILKNACPNCGGNLCARPIRPAQDGKNGNDLMRNPASTKRVFRPVDSKAHTAWIATRVNGCG